MGAAKSARRAWLVLIAVTSAEEAPVVRTLLGAITGDPILCVLIAAGLELSQNGHIRFTELCQCTCSNRRSCGDEIASIDLEIQTYPINLARNQRFFESA